MKPYYEEQGIQIWHGDCREILPSLLKVDLCLTDPPYGLEFMGKEWDHGVPGRETWEAVLRVLKPGAPLMAFGGTRTHHRLMCAIEDAGFEIRDCLMWLYGSGFPKSLDISKAIDKAAGAERAVIGRKERIGGMNPAHEGWQRPWQSNPVAREAKLSITAPTTDAAKLWDGYGTALKPAWEPIILAMKPCEGTFAENALKHGVAGLNIDAGRIGTADNTAGGDAAGRWPANLLLDEESAAMLDEQSGITTSVAGVRHNSYRNGNSLHDGAAKDVMVNHADSGGASRFFYTAKADSSERGNGNDHPTVKPLDLMAYLCKLACPPNGGVLLDPFMGSGSTLKAGRRFFRQCIGIDSDEHACEIAVNRLAQSVLDFDPPRPATDEQMELLESSPEHPEGMDNGLTGLSEKDSGEYPIETS